MFGPAVNVQRSGNRPFRWADPRGPLSRLCVPLSRVSCSRRRIGAALWSTSERTMAPHRVHCSRLQPTR